MRQLQMKDKVLIVASVASMIDQFNMPNIILLKKMGYEVDVACNFVEGNTCSFERIQTLKEKLKKLNVDVFQIDFCRSPMAFFKNIKAYKQVLKLMRFTHYRFVHCHSPIGGLCARIAAHKTQTKVIYTAHGFHFYKGAPLLNWLFYYPIEYMLSYYTDVLITINHEDYNRSLTFHAKQNVYIPGVGVNLAKFHIATPDEKLRKRLQLNLGLEASDIVCMCVGELNKNKNQLFIIKNIERLLSTYPQLKLFIVGRGKEYVTLDAYIKNNGLAANVFLLGYRTDICDILNASDIGISASIREGLPVNVIEFVASGLKVICADNRGHRDIAEHTHVLIYKQSDSDDFVKILRECINNKNIDSHDKNDISSFAEENVIFQLNQLYKNTSS